MLRRRLRLAVAVSLVPAALTSSALSQSFVTGYESPGASQGVNALLVHDEDGLGPRPLALYLAGEFETAGSVVAGNIARYVGGLFSPLDSGTNGSIAALVAFDPDGSGPAAALLIAGGNFSRAGSVGAANVAAWNGGGWSALGAGLDDWVTALAVVDFDAAGPQPPTLFAGGLFRTSGGAPTNHVARFSGGNWLPVAGGFDAPPSALFAFTEGATTALYAGGFFTQASLTSSAHLARFAGTSWQPVGTGVNAQVNSLAAFDADGPSGLPARLVLGGTFTQAGLANVAGIATLVGTSFLPLQNGIAAPGAQPNVRALLATNIGAGTALYAAGLFRSAGGISSTPTTDDLAPLLLVARWNGTSWSALGTGPMNNANSAARALAAYDDDFNGIPSLFVGGYFSTAGAAGTACIAKWDGLANWLPLGTGQGFDRDVRAIEATPLGVPGSVAVAGDFRTAGLQARSRVVLSNGVGWTPLGTGFDHTVRALESNGPVLYAGGDFRTAGPVPVAHVARFDGATWGPMLGGVDGRVHALTTFQSRLVVAGEFHTAGGALAAGIASWNESPAQWFPIGAGFDDTVRCVRVFDDGSGARLYAGGDFTRSGTTSTSGIARWNGLAWEAVGSGFVGAGVFALLAFDAGAGPALYAGGEFTSSAGSRLDGIARWDSLTNVWRPLALGFQGGRPTRIEALAEVNDALGHALVAGGTFTNSGSLLVSNLARWNGASWSAIGSGANAAVHALEVVPGPGGGTLYVGGAFSLLNGTPASRIGRTP